MSNQPNDKSKLQRMLEAATSTDMPSDVMLDEETAELREGWDALGQMLQARDDQFDPNAVVVQLKRRQSKRRTRLAAMAAVAASLLVALGVGGYWIATSPDGATTVKNDRSNGKKIESPNETPADVNLDWDDSWDSEVALASEEIIRVQQDWHATGGPLLILQHQLDEIEQGIDEESL